MDRLNAMEELLKDAFTGIQSLIIQATQANASAIANALRNIQIVYNTLDEMSKESEADGNGRVPEAE
jgi:hypothetical protein